jgi:hypothetical protein
MLYVNFSSMSMVVFRIMEFFSTYLATVPAIDLYNYWFGLFVFSHD